MKKILFSLLVVMGLTVSACSHMGSCHKHHECCKSGCKDGSCKMENHEGCDHKKEAAPAQPAK